MRITAKTFAVACAATATSFGLLSAAHAAVTVDGSLTGDTGYTLTSLQINRTSSLQDGGNPQGPGAQATAASTGSFTQLSNVYTQFDTVNNALDLFIGGSINTGDNGVSHYIIALQTHTGGVATLSNQAVIKGSVYNVNNPSATGFAPPNSDGLNSISFDTGFLPTGLLIVQPNTAGTGTATGTGAYTGFSDLTGGTNTTTPIVGYNGALQNIPVGTGAVGDPGFANASTGTEISIPLAGLGYIAGTPILASIFTTNGGSDGRTNNQVLSPFVYNPADTSGGYDYTYIDNNEGGNTAGITGRQFTGIDYLGAQFFTITPAAVPEPASAGLLALGAVGFLSRRARKV